MDIELFMHFKGLLLILCSGMHTVWAIYQSLFYQTSEAYREDLKSINGTEWEERFFKVVMYSGRGLLMFTIVMWYIGMMLGCFMAGWFLVRIVQKKNIYVSFFAYLHQHLNKTPI